MENGLLAWSLSDPEEGVSSSRVSCLYSQCRRQRPLETAVSATGAGGRRGAGAVLHGGPPAPRDVDSGAPPASVSARPGPAEPWAARDKLHVTSSCRIASSAQCFGDINSWLKGGKLNTLLGVIVLLAYEKQPPFSPWGQRSTVFMPVCGMSASCGWVAVPVCGC